MLILFDFDGTIADTINMQLGIAQDILNSDFGYALDSSQLVELKKVFSEKGGLAVLRQLKFPMYKFPMFLKSIKDKQTISMANMKILPEIKDCIISIKKLAQVGILSAGSSKYVKPFIQNNEISDLFDYVYTDDSGDGKEILLKKFLDNTNITPKEIIYVGDETQDLIICNKLKISVVAVTWGVNSKNSFVELNPAQIVDTPIQLFTYIKNKLR